MVDPTTPPRSPNALTQLHSSHGHASKAYENANLTPPDSPRVTPLRFNAPQKASGLPVPHEFDQKDALCIVRQDIGEGQWSTVSMAVAHGKTYACKRPRGKQAAKILYREAQILTVLSEPSNGAEFVIPFFGIDSSENTLVLEFASVSLEGFVKKSGPIATTEHLACLARNLVQGLQFLKACNIIHGDIKPGNILMTGDGDGDDCEMRAVYCDFSASRVDDPDCKLNESAGTYDFMAPELFDWRNGQDTPTFASDAFALGMTLIWTALGYSPYEYADTYSKVSMAKQGEPLKFIRNSSWADQTTNVDLDQLVGGALKKKVEERWTASEWLQHLS